ncbi:hypothetical protein [Ensifer adhaerens]|uniref:hypothetical protein n=1 Tax=Ensifer adhaerens TaxID=106592 RepID=UPI000CF0E4C8|nr:hypothetical protein [Ensifer adhaerens]
MMSSMSLNTVYAVRATQEADVYNIRCNITDYLGVSCDTEYCSRPDDTVGINPVIRQWLRDNPDVQIEAYTPPEPLTEDALRQRMPSLTARQLRLGLVNANVSPSTVTATIAVMPTGPDRDKAQIEWEYATTFKRTHPLIATVGTALGLSDAEIDALWAAAAAL